MAKQTLAEIKEHIAQLQKQAEELKAQEVTAVVARIREAIAVYGLTERELFGRLGVGAKKSGRAAAAGKRKPGVVRYRDDAGNAWTGHGKRPNWFKDAIASGKKPEDLLVRR
ncbi:MAG TPA: H-NS histone family protein [Burkholderiaceae bacterium]|nr:H-NS histone family protein [Burkholderiaceae bacterium]